jgi:hypothetical protein
METPDSLVKHAVQEIVQEINSGLSPQAATTKVAKVLELKPNFIKRSCEAINVALHHNHFKNHPNEKAADFDTVDSQQIIDEVYSTKEKTASEFRSELFSSFQIPETAPKFSRYLEAGPHKEAFAKFVSAPDAGKTPMSEKGVYNKAANYIKDLKKTAYDAEGAKLGAKFEVEQSFCNILRKFAEDPAYRSSWDQFETSVFAKHGSVSTGYLDLLYKTAKLNEERGKQDSTIKLASLCKEVELFTKFLDKVAALKEATAASEDAAYNLKYEEDYLRDAFHNRGCELNKSAFSDDSLLEKVEKSIKAERRKIAEVNQQDPVLLYIAEKKAGVETEFDGRIKSAIDLVDMVKGPIGGVAKPNLSASTNTPDANRERALMLQELVSTDPIISKFPTHHVVDAYQQMLRIAPELSSEREVTRAFLRQAGATQAIDPFQAEQLIKANTSLFKQHQLQKGIQPSPEKIS